MMVSMDYSFQNILYIILKENSIYILVKHEVEAKIANQTKHGRRLSVLMFYNDGLSHAMSRRVLNQTYYYLLNEHGGIPLAGYHTVAYSTFPNMIPYLTGIYC